MYKLLWSTNNSDEEVMHHINQEMEAKIIALFRLDRFEIYKHVPEIFIC